MFLKKSSSASTKATIPWLQWNQNKEIGRTKKSAVKGDEQVAILQGKFNDQLLPSTAPVNNDSLLDSLHRDRAASLANSSSCENYLNQRRASVQERNSAGHL